MGKKLLLFGLFIYSIISFSKSLKEENSYREKIDLNNDWQFVLEPENNIQKIDLPHDFSISQPFTTECESESGFLPGGSGLYIKTFTLKKDSPFTAILYFYGIYKDSYITVNGHKVGENHYGYNSFAFDVSKYLTLDGKTENEIKIKVDHELFSSRWYSGSGIYRGVYLLLTDLIHIGLDGIKITTQKIVENHAGITIETKIINNDLDDDNKMIKLNYTIKSKEDEKIIFNRLSNEKKEIKKGETLIKEEMVVENIKLWSDKDPNLYTVEIEIISGDKNDQILDKYSLTYGFRTYYFDKDKGFIINGTPTKLHGVCLHHDYGALGSIDNYDAAYRRFVQLKEMGINALRTSHNPAYRTWIDICDKLGIYVIEEFFDTWNYSKGSNKHDFSEYFNQIITEDNEILGKKNGMTWAEYVVKSTIIRDRNSPSIIMWSIGNEIQVKNGSDSIGKNLLIYGKEVDDSRPFTRGDSAYKKNDNIQIAINEEIVNSGGVIGYNYPGLEDLQNGLEMYGNIYLSESASALNSRGIYSTIENTFSTKKDDGKYHLTSYDVSYASWGAPAYFSLRVTLSQDYNAGQFVWTGFDYIGEPTPYNGITPGSQTGKGPYPNSAYFGFIDTCGFPKDSYYLYRAHLRKNSTTVHIVSAWDKNNIYFVDQEKKMTPVHIYSNAAVIEVYRDDIEKSICISKRAYVKTKAGYEYFTYSIHSNNNNVCQEVPSSDSELSLGTDLFSRYNIEFKEGTSLYIKAYDEQGKLIDGKNIVGNYFIKAPNLNKLKLDIKIDKNKIKADRKSLVYVEVSVVDEEGILNTIGNNLIVFSLSGPGKILGVDNGDQATIDKYQQKNVLVDSDYATIKAYAGKALAIVSSTSEKGVIKINISSDGLNEEEISINSEE